MKNLTGQRFGRLVAVEPTDKRTKDGNVVWSLRCDCGNTCEAPTSELMRGRVRSCGCARHDPRGRDLTGQRFGKLEVIGRRGASATGQAMWDCRCDCGNEIVASTRSLEGGKKSCGCEKSRSRDLAGRRFGRLTALRPVGRRSGYVVWECRCDCGNYKDVTSQLLTTGRTRSCGCLRADRAAMGKRSAGAVEPAIASVELEAAPSTEQSQSAPSQSGASGAVKLRASRTTSVRPGSRFGDLIVVDEAADEREGSRTWRCVSDAGEVVYRTADELAALRGGAGEGAA